MSGRDSLTDVVDHILPTQDFPELIHEPENRQSLCHECHILKGRLEAYARRARCLEKLVEWSADPSSRPAAFRG